MSRRSMIIGAQAAAVVLSVVIVYVTLLRPDSTAPLHEIKAPGSEQQASKPPHDRGHKGGDRRGGHKGAGGSNNGGGGSLAGGGQEAQAQGSTLVSSGTPPGDQYSDEVGALLSRVAMAAPREGVTSDGGTVGGVATGRAGG